MPRGFLAQCRVFPLGIVGIVHAVEDRQVGGAVHSPELPLDRFCLDGPEEALDGGVIMAIAFARHRYHELISAQDFRSLCKGY